MNKSLYIIKDITKSILAGVIISLALIILSGLISMIIKRGDIKSVLQIIKGTLFIIGSLGLIVSSGFILKKESRRPLDNKDSWKEQFKVLSFVKVFLIIGIIILLFGNIIDVIIFYL